MKDEVSSFPMSPSPRANSAKPNFQNEPKVLSVPQSYHIFWQLVSREILYIFMVIIYDVCQFSPINRFFKDPHLNCGGKLRKFLDIITNYFCNSWTPMKETVEKKKKLNSLGQKGKKPFDCSSEESRSDSDSGNGIFFFFFLDLKLQMGCRISHKPLEAQLFVPGKTQPPTPPHRPVTRKAPEFGTRSKTKHYPLETNKHQPILEESITGRRETHLKRWHKT